MTAPHLGYVATFHISVGAPIDAGPGHRLIPVLGGHVEGENLSGRILPGGADWQTLGPDDAINIGGRWVMETGDGTRIQVETPGIRNAPAGTAANAAGDPARRYFRVAPRFVVAAPDYRWLLQSLFIGRGVKGPEGVEIAVYAVE